MGSQPKPEAIKSKPVDVAGDKKKKNKKKTKKPEEKKEEVTPKEVCY